MNETEIETRQMSLDQNDGADKPVYWFDTTGGLVLTCPHCLTSCGGGYDDGRLPSEESYLAWVQCDGCGARWERTGHERFWVRSDRVPLRERPPLAVDFTPPMALPRVQVLGRIAWLDPTKTIQSEDASGGILAPWQSVLRSRPMPSVGRFARPNWKAMEAVDLQIRHSLVSHYLGMLERLQLWCEDAWGQPPAVMVLHLAGWEGTVGNVDGERHWMLTSKVAPVALEKAPSRSFLTIRCTTWDRIPAMGS